jgi:hypothetical protein
VRVPACDPDGRPESGKFDQHFGIAGAFDRPWAVKQGWAGAYAKGTCGPQGAAGTRAATAEGAAPKGAADVDLTRPAAVLTTHPVGTSYAQRV